jgi:Hypothetical glycosyl hydrolase family 15
VLFAAAAATAAVALASPPTAPASTANAIGVVADQLPDGMPPALVQFAATHDDGAQKLGRTTTLALKAQNPRFFVLQYRLALGLGRTTQIRFGDGWRPEWPARPRERWFFHWHGSRVRNQTWGWYVMNVDDGGWRAYYVAKLHQQVESTAADGAFLDSASVPNYLGATSFAPPLPAVDPLFEAAWSKRIARWLPTVQRRLGKPVVANVGSWVTTRDRTDYSGVGGVMIEGFATGLAPDDWKLELTRALGLVRRGKIVIAQSYPAAGDVQARMFDLASYLLIKGTHTYVDFPLGIEVDWFPEYGIDLGAAVDPPGLRQQDGVYVRRYAKGLVAANPGDSPLTLQLDGTYERLVPHGGGRVPESGQLPAAWGLGETPVQSVTLGPREGAVLLH